MLTSLQLTTPQFSKNWDHGIMAQKELGSHSTKGGFIFLLLHGQSTNIQAEKEKENRRQLLGRHAV